MKGKTHLQELFNVFEVPKFWRDTVNNPHVLDNCKFAIFLSSLELQQLPHKTMTCTIASKLANLASVCENPHCCCIASLLPDLQCFGYQSSASRIFLNSHTLLSRFTFCLIMPYKIGLPSTVPSSPYLDSCSDMGRATLTSICEGDTLDLTINVWLTLVHFS